MVDFALPGLAFIYDVHDDFRSQIPEVCETRDPAGNSPLNDIIALRPDGIYGRGKLLFVNSDLIDELRTDFPSSIRHFLEVNVMIRKRTTINLWVVKV